MQNSLDSFKYCPRCGQESFENRNINAKHCPHCDLSFYANVASAVACLIKDENERYLFVKRAKEPAKGTLDMTGGFVDPLETVEEAVAREVYEETKLKVKSIKYLCSIPNIYPFSGINVFTADLFFLVETEDFSQAEACDDAEAISILEFSEIKEEMFGLQSIKKFISKLTNKEIVLD